VKADALIAAATDKAAQVQADADAVAAQAAAQAAEITARSDELAAITAKIEQAQRKIAKLLE
jgi:hypothetical protein